MASTKREDPYLFQYVEVIDGKERGARGQVVDSHNGYLYLRVGDKIINVRRKDVEFGVAPTRTTQRVAKTDARVVKAFKECMVESPTLSSSERKGIFGLMLILADSRV